MYCDLITELMKYVMYRIVGAAVYFAIRNAIQAARADVSADKTPESFDYIQLNAPATSERIRTACQDPLLLRCTNNNRKFQSKGSW